MLRPSLDSNVKVPCQFFVSKALKDMQNLEAASLYCLCYGTMAAYADTVASGIYSYLACRRNAPQVCDPDDCAVVRRQDIHFDPQLFLGVGRYSFKLNW